MAKSSKTREAKGIKPDYAVFQIIEIEGRDKDKFYEIGVAFDNTKADDGSINLMTVHGKLQLRIIEDND